MTQQQLEASATQLRQDLEARGSAQLQQIHDEAKLLNQQLECRTRRLMALGTPPHCHVLLTVATARSHPRAHL